MSKFDVGDKVQVGTNPFWHFGSRKRWNFIADRAGMTGEVVTWDDESGDYRVKFSDNAFWISSECLTLVPEPEPAKSPLTEEQIEFLRDLWWNEPAGTDAERILGELLKWRV